MTVAPSKENAAVGIRAVCIQLHQRPRRRFQVQTATLAVPKYLFIVNAISNYPGPSLVPPTPFPSSLPPAEQLQV